MINGHAALRVYMVEILREGALCCIILSERALELKAFFNNVSPPPQ